MLALLGGRPSVVPWDLSIICGPMRGQKGMWDAVQYSTPCHVMYCTVQDWSMRKQGWWQMGIWSWWGLRTEDLRLCTLSANNQGQELQPTLRRKALRRKALRRNHFLSTFAVVILPASGILRSPVIYPKSTPIDASDLPTIALVYSLLNVLSVILKLQSRTYSQYVSLFHCQHGLCLVSIYVCTKVGSLRIHREMWGRSKAHVPTG